MENSDLLRRAEDLLRLRKHQIDRDEASCRMNLITKEQPDLFSEKL